MIKKRALITGISGQDGSFLAEYLLELGNYDIFGIVRRNSIPEHQEGRISHLLNRIETIYGDMTDPSSLQYIIKKVQPDEIYNLAAQSHVRISFDIPQFTTQVNALGVLNLLEAVKHTRPTIRIYHASSSEMFGNSCDEDGFQRLSTPMSPVSPYGCAKLFAYNICKIYRSSYNMFICNGILFNHESSRRASNFVTQKIINGAINIKYGKQTILKLGNLDSYRDWGHSKDYVRAIHRILNYPIARDWIVSSMQTKSVRELCQYVFTKLGLDYNKYVVKDEKYIRPNELKYLRGDSTETRKELNWEPEYTFEMLIDEMIKDAKERL